MLMRSSLMPCSLQCFDALGSNACREYDVSEESLEYCIGMLANDAGYTDAMLSAVI